MLQRIRVAPDGVRRLGDARHVELDAERARRVLPGPAVVFEDDRLAQEARHPLGEHRVRVGLAGAAQVDPQCVHAGVYSLGVGEIEDERADEQEGEQPARYPR